eukprot:GFUD01000558.1.p1 GENE.GFUD01000558.1~~GFUD01000558.1.p1  ORF type:complete len:210 (-),score=49.21 GFUD01000558.1:354-983(-)
MSIIELQAYPASPPSQAVHMVLDLLGLEYEYVEASLLDGVTKTPEHLSMNPVLTDGNLVITDSRAAMTYLASKHMPSMLTYPFQRLYFNITALYQRMGDCVYPVCCGQTMTVPEEKKEALEKALMMANQMTRSCGYVLGNHMTIADVDFMATYSTLEACDFINLASYGNLNVWAERMKQQIPKFAESCGKGAAAFGDCFNENYSVINEC